jgi:hypothetical protein
LFDALDPRNAYERVKRTGDELKQRAEILSDSFSDWSADRETNYSKQEEYFVQEERITISDADELTGYKIAGSVADKKNYQGFSGDKIEFWHDGYAARKPDELRIVAGEDFMAYNSEKLDSEEVADALQKYEDQLADEIDQKKTEKNEMESVRQKLEP